MSIIQISSGKNTRRKPRFPARLNSCHLLGRPSACWLMNEGGGQSIFDVSRNTNTGTLNGGVKWQPTSKGSALSFDGQIGSYVTTGMWFDNTIANKSSFSVSCWVNLASISADCGIAGDAAGGQWQFKLAFSVSGNRRFNFQTSRGGLFSNAQATANTWYHLTTVLDNTVPTLSLYLNGTLDKSSTIQGGSYSALNPFYIGWTGVAGTSTQYLNGQLSDFRVYPTVLSPSQIWRLYQRPYEMILSPHTSRGLIFGYLKPAYAKNIGINLHFNT